MPVAASFSEEQARTVIDLEQRYERWIEAERALMSLPYGRHRKTIGDRAYLCEVRDRQGNGRNLGPWSDDQERRLADYRTTKENARDRQRTTKGSSTCRDRWRALRLALLANEAGSILQGHARKHLFDADRQLRPITFLIGHRRGLGTVDFSSHQARRKTASTVDEGYLIGMPCPALCHSFTIDIP